ncbi:MAG: NAD(P)/FAD-dependent oxidoreductase [Geminicoccaceae bacterium]|nr:NAD(P)/FAD-dependent oxidoreductase [Geminicoccaceae bacterium]MCB9969739.1 NAD(P)/FAD-dependent oxidoreductase [Geminicoccaceae bacterium]HRY26509.1 NAD(P)/FAD-dependent oxidoreductase [Geminicoccaceae bacterium]
MTDRIECVVVGAGVVGLAVAAALARSGREVIVLERHGLIGSETSSRNSEVIHAGIYYPTGSLKARLCVAGKQALYRYCGERGIPHRNCGKLIVATSDGQLDELERIRLKAAENGVTDLEQWDAARARELEPELACTGALWSPSTGIIDSHSLMLAYQGDIEDGGGMIAFNASLERARVTGEGFHLEVGGEAPMEIECAVLVNSAGLEAPNLARRIEGYDPAHAPAAHYCKGNYYTLKGRSPFDRLIYPVPEAAGLGVHVTVDMGGQCRFGPDVEWVESIQYDVDPRRAEVFYAAVRKYWPGLQDGALEPGYSGIRPKLGPAGAPAADFVVQGAAAHGVSGLVHLFGIESPGLTASPAIGEMVLATLEP